MSKIVVVRAAMVEAMKAKDKARKDFLHTSVELLEDLDGTLLGNLADAF